MAKILIVDDDEMLVSMYKTKFLAEGFEFETAIDGEEGLAKVAQNRPDLILLDILMPKVNGLDMLKKLKEDPEAKSIPVILLTNVGDSTNAIQQGVELGVVAYLIKANYTPSEIVARVRQILAEYPPK